MNDRVQAPLWRLHITIAELPVTTPDQTQVIKDTMPLLADDRTMTITWAGSPGRFTFTLTMYAAKPRDAAMLFERTLSELCLELTDRAPRLDSFTAEPL
jgi:hypothetical protein